MWGNKHPNQSETKLFPEAENLAYGDGLQATRPKE
jgi:hypothetical protein